jgi:hypothetical protein
MNLGAFFKNPPSSLQTLCPSFGVSTTDGVTNISYLSNSFTDQTLGGLYPTLTTLNSECVALGSYTLSSSETLGTTDLNVGILTFFYQDLYDIEDN